jgi:hypothetical protein
MYRPTAGILDVPTYGSGPDSWGQKPPASEPVTDNHKKSQ